MVLEDELLKLLPQVNGWFQEANMEAPFREYILVGGQSSGKSALMQRVVGFPINITKKDTGTRRPLKVVLEHSPAQTTPLCHLDGQKIAAEDVLQAVWQVNADLAKRNEFEFTPLSLKVSWSKVVTMTIIDLPGLKCTQEKCDATAADGTDHRNKIKEIIQQTMKGQRYQLVVVLDPEEFTSNKVVNFLDEVHGTNAHQRHAWSKDSIFVMCKVDRILNDPGFKQKDALTQFLAKYQDNKIRPYLVYNDPSPDLESKLEASMGNSNGEHCFREMTDHIGKLQEKEMELFESYEGKIGQGCVSEDFRENLTFQRLQEKLHLAYKKDFQMQLPKVRNALRDGLELMNKRLQSLDEDLKDDKGHEVARRAREVVYQKCEQGVGSFIDGHDIDTLRRHDGSKTTLEEEILETKKSSFLSLTSDFEDCISSQPRRSEYCPGERLLGGEQRQRKFAFAMDVLSRNMKSPCDIADHEVRSMIGFGRSGHPDWERAILEMVRYCVRDDLQATVDWYVNAVGTDLLKYWDLSLQDVLLELEKSLKQKPLTPRVLKYIQESFNEKLVGFLQKMQERLRLDVEPQLSQLWTPILDQIRIQELSEILTEVWNTVESSTTAQAKCNRIMEQVGKFMSEMKPVRHCVNEGQQEDVLTRHLDAVSLRRASQPLQELVGHDRALVTSTQDIQEMKNCARKYQTALVMKITRELEPRFLHLYNEFKDEVKKCPLRHEELARLATEDFDVDKLRHEKKKTQYEIDMVNQILSDIEPYLKDVKSERSSRAGGA